MKYLSFDNRFFRQFIAFFATHQMAMALFRFLGAVLKTMVVANTFGMFVLLIIFIFGGFVIRRSKYNSHNFLFI
jgi:ABC-type multidrug transport system permease subunit